MGLIASMATAITGLEANGNALSIISDNIVNANTTGFKSGRAEFQSLLAQDLSIASGLELGRGCMLGGASTVFTQGSITRTDRGTDCAVNGNGFFMLRDPNRGVTFTRDGSFRFDKDGWLTSLGGHHVQAYQASPEGKITGKLGDIRIPYNTMPSKPTENVQIHVNLDARLPSNAEFDLMRPEESSQFVSSIQVFDSIGNAHAVTLCFNKKDDSNWEWAAFTDGGNIKNGTPGRPAHLGGGSMSFDVEGKLINREFQPIRVDFANGAIPNQEIRFDFGPPLTREGTTSADGSTQFGSKSAAFRSIQDGWSAGYLADVMVDGEGILTGNYTNGQNRPLGQLALARFEATEKLAKVGENQYRETVTSGQPSIGKPNSNGRGHIMTKSLENSNVDIAKEFVEMIKIQRGFQASAKSISSANEMMEEVINIKRG